MQTKSFSVLADFDASVSHLRLVRDVTRVTNHELLVSSSYFWLYGWYLGVFCSLVASSVCLLLLSRGNSPSTLSRFSCLELVDCFYDLVSLFRNRCDLGLRGWMSRIVIVLLILVGEVGGVTIRRRGVCVRGLLCIPLQDLY